MTNVEVFEDERCETKPLDIVNGEFAPDFNGWQKDMDFTC